MNFNFLATSIKQSTIPKPRFITFKTLTQFDSSVILFSIQKVYQTHPTAFYPEIEWIFLIVSLLKTIFSPQNMEQWRIFLSGIYVDKNVTAIAKITF